MEPADKAVYKQAVPPQVAACANHAGREAIGICVQCRTRVCSECATKVEGINYCVSCLSGLAVEGGRQLSPRVAASAAMAYVSAGAYFITLWALVWVFLEVVLPGGR
ncbi:MAG TPA: B-box zinc finger protein [Polyangiales bacterium]